jgi:hypothetical protein
MPLVEMAKTAINLVDKFQHGVFKPGNIAE